MDKYKVWAKAALIRAIRTVAQTALALIGAAVVMADVNWSYVLSGSLLAGILSIVTSVATGLPEVDAAIEKAKEEQFDTDGEGL